MFLVYKKISDYDYAQRYVEEGEAIPAGWSVEIPEVKSPEDATDLATEVQRQKVLIESQADAIEDLGNLIAELMSGGAA